MNYNLKVWRNKPDEFLPTIDEDLNESQLIEYLNIVISNIRSRSTTPLVEKILLTKLETKR